MDLPPKAINYVIKEIKKRFQNHQNNFSEFRTVDMSPKPHPDMLRTTQPPLKPQRGDM